MQRKTPRKRKLIQTLSLYCYLLKNKRTTLPKKTNNETKPTLGFVLADLYINFRENSEIGYRINNVQWLNLNQEKDFFQVLKSHDLQNRPEG